MPALWVFQAHRGTGLTCRAVLSTSGGIMMNIGKLFQHQLPI